MQLLLKKIAIISPGYPIRDAVRDMPGGEIAVVQIKNVDAEKGVDWATVTRTNLKGRRDPDWLRAGDVLFAARGHRNAAVCLDQNLPKAVCSPHFFLIRPRDVNAALPEFIAWQMNLPVAQQYFAQSATGSYIKSIRRDVLERLELAIPSLDQQRLLVTIAKTAQREKETLEHLIENRRREVELVAQNLLTPMKKG